MKKIIFLGAIFLVLGLGSVAWVDVTPLAQTSPPAQDKKMPEVVVLGAEAKIGKVTFNHVKHNSGTYTVDGESKIACVTCHHTGQPASELVKYPPLKTAWPTDRTTILTAELFGKDPNGAGVAACRDCHARAGQKPKLLAEMPIVKTPGGTDLTVLNNQQAFHRACDACHFNLGFQRPEAKLPKATQCASCHKRTA